MTILARLIGIAVLLIPLVAVADKVTLNNGDTLTGGVVSMSEGVLVLATDYSGQVQIPWEEIDDLQTDEPIRVQTGSGDVITGRIVGIEDGNLMFAEPERSPSAGKVQAFNPPQTGFKLSGNADAGATISRGNSESSSFSASVESEARSKLNRIITGASYYRTSEEGVDTAENARAYGRYARFISKRWFLASNISFEHDPFRDLDLRSTAGVGLGYQFYDRDDLELSLQAGANAVRDDFDVAEDESFVAGRLAVDYRQRVLAGIELFHSSQLLPPLDAPGEYTYISRTGFRMPLFASLNGTFQISFDYDNDPPAGLDNADLVYTFKVGYGW